MLLTMRELMFSKCLVVFLREGPQEMLQVVIGSLVSAFSFLCCKICAEHSVCARVVGELWAADPS